MRLVVDADVLVAELLRARGVALLLDERLELAIADEIWDEAQHELEHRLDALQHHRRLTDLARATLRDRAVQAVAASIDVVPSPAYAAWEEVARRRLPRDPRDWPTVALALQLGAAVWTNDCDYLGCGCPT